MVKIWRKTCWPFLFSVFHSWNYLSVPEDSRKWSLRACWDQMRGRDITGHRGWGKMKPRFRMQPDEANRDEVVPVEEVRWSTWRSTWHDWITSDEPIKDQASNIVNCYWEGLGTLANATLAYVRNNKTVETEKVTQMYMFTCYWEDQLYSCLLIKLILMKILLDSEKKANNLMPLMAGSKSSRIRSTIIRLFRNISIF